MICFVFQIFILFLGKCSVNPYPAIASSAVIEDSCHSRASVAVIEGSCHSRAGVAVIEGSCHSRAGVAVVEGSCHSRAGVAVIEGSCHSRVGGNPFLICKELTNEKWVPACAGMTAPCAGNDSYPQ